MIHAQISTWHGHMKIKQLLAFWLIRELHISLLAAEKLQAHSLLVGRCWYHGALDHASNLHFVTSKHVGCKHIPAMLGTTYDALVMWAMDGWVEFHRCVNAVEVSTYTFLGDVRILTEHGSALDHGRASAVWTDDLAFF